MLARSSVSPSLPQELQSDEESFDLLRTNQPFDCPPCRPNMDCNKQSYLSHSTMLKSKMLCKKPRRRHVVAPKESQKIVQPTIDQAVAKLGVKAKVYKSPKDDDGRQSGQGLGLSPQKEKVGSFDVGLEAVENKSNSGILPNWASDLQSSHCTRVQQTWWTLSTRWMRFCGSSLNEPPTSRWLLRFRAFLFMRHRPHSIFDKRRIRSHKSLSYKSPKWTHSKCGIRKQKYAIKTQKVLSTIHWSETDGDSQLSLLDSDDKLSKLRVNYKTWSWLQSSKANEKPKVVRVWQKIPHKRLKRVEVSPRV